MKRNAEQPSERPERAAHIALRTWGVWVQSGRARGGSCGLVFDYGVTAAPDRGDGAVRGYVPLEPIECARTERFVTSLPPELRAVAIECYCNETTAERHAQRLRVSKRTMYARLGHVWDRYDAWIDAGADRKKNFVQ